MKPMKSSITAMILLPALRQRFQVLARSLIGCDALMAYPSTRRHTGSFFPMFRLHSPGRNIRNESCMTISYLTHTMSLKPDDISITKGNEVPDVDSTAALLKAAYEIGETDKVQDAINSRSILPLLFEDREVANVIDDVGSHLIEAAIKAATIDNRINRGALSGIMNAILACCCSNKQHDSAIEHIYPELAWEILQKMDEIFTHDESSMVSPDLVTLSLVYYSCSVAQQSSPKDIAMELKDFHHGIQSKILERARKLSKKSAGSSRRKALAAERRKKSLHISEDLAVDLQSLYGPDIAILHEDNDIIVLSKPAGMVCYHNRKTSAGKVTTSRKKKSRDKKGGDDPYGTKLFDISLEDALLDMTVPLSTLNPAARGIVHRIDRGTSGAIVLAKNDQTHLKLIALFFLREVHKKYFALVPAVSSDGEWNLATEDTIDSVVDARPALSKYKIVERYVDPTQTEKNAGPAALLLEVQTFTGRKHQVRVHCANGLNRPIFLDPLYSHIGTKTPGKNNKNKHNIKDEESKVRAIPPLILQAVGAKEQFFLHASTITIPQLGVDAVAPLPKWWVDIFAEWEKLK